MMSEVEVTALRDDIAARAAALEPGPAAPDEASEPPAERAQRRARLQMAADVLTHVLRGP